MNFPRLCKLPRKVGEPVEPPRKTGKLVETGLVNMSKRFGHFDTSGTSTSSVTDVTEI